MSEQLSEREIRAIIREAFAENTKGLEMRLRLQMLEAKDEISQSIRNDIGAVIGVDPKEHLIQHANWAEAAKEVKSLKDFVVKRIVWGAITVLFAVVVIAAYPTIARQVPGIVKESHTKTSEVATHATQS